MLMLLCRRRFLWSGLGENSMAKLFLLMVLVLFTSCQSQNIQEPIVDIEVFTSGFWHRNAWLGNSHGVGFHFRTDGSFVYINNSRVLIERYVRRVDSCLRQFNSYYYGANRNCWWYRMRNHAFNNWWRKKCF